MTTETINGISEEDILNAVAEEYGVSVEAIMSRRLTRDVSDARHMAMYLFKKTFALTITGVAEKFCRSRASVLYGIERTEGGVEWDRVIKHHYRNLTEKLENMSKEYKIVAMCGSPEEHGMSLNGFQQLALETAIYPEEYRITYPALGLAGEAGEVADKVKKVIRDNHGDFNPVKCEEIAMEIGDVLWCCAVLADRIGYHLDTIGRMNCRKLKSRMERGKLGGNGDNR